jgi:cobalamin-dependent methionine synthase I
MTQMSEFLRPAAGQTTGHPEQSTSAIVVPHPEAKYFIA